MKKLLYLKSVSESNDDELFKIPKEKAHEMNYELRVVFLSDENKKNPLTPDIAGRKVFSFYYTLSLLEKEISTYAPNVIALHTGVSFMFYFTDIIQALTVIKIKYPRIKLVYEPKRVFQEHTRVHHVRNMHASNYTDSRDALHYFLLAENEIFDFDEHVNYILWK